MNEIKVGQRVYYQYFGYRDNHKREPEETKVTKVGRKWFEVEAAKWERYSIKTLLNDSKGYSSSSRIILSIEDYMNEQEQTKLYAFISEHFGTWRSKKVTLQQLREIAKILNVDQPQTT